MKVKGGKSKITRFLLSLLLFMGMLFAKGIKIPEYTAVFTESFDNTDYMEVTSSVANWGGGTVFPNKERSFYFGNDNDINVVDFPDWVDVLTSNDFTGDGITDYVVSGSSYANVLALFSDTDSSWDNLDVADIHWIDGSQGDLDGPDWGVDGSPIDTDGYCALTSGDYDGDGDNDFFFLVSHSYSPYSIERIWLYKNNLVENGSVSFTQTDLTSAWGATLGGIAWTSSSITSVDLDFDKYVDILFGNKDGEVYWAENFNSETVDEDTFILEEEPIIETGWGDRGITVLAAADFDQDDDIDIVVGSVSRQKLSYYENPGEEVFGNKTDIGDQNDSGDWGEKFAGAATFHICRDLDNDGFPDLLVGTDGFNYGNGIGGRVYHFDYRKIDKKFLVRRILTLPVSGGDEDAVYDLDFIAFTDDTGSGLFDNIFAGNYYFDSDWENEGGRRVEVKALPIEETEYYNIQAIAESTVVAPFAEGKKLITKVILKDLEQGILGKGNKDIQLNYYISNNGGLTWYLVEDFKNSEIKDKDGKVKEIKFKEYGSQLSWKAEFLAKGDEIGKDNYIGAAVAAPYIDSLTLEYKYVDEMEFSRASSAATTVNIGDSNKKIVIAPSFVFPSWEGHLRAYEVTSMSFDGDPAYDVKTVSVHDSDDSTGRDIQAENTTLLWDAGEVLNNRLASNRDIYTSIPEGKREGPLNRVEFTTLNYEEFKKYFKGKINLVSWIRGENRDFKLGWIDHSTPIVVNPPNGDDTTMGNDYYEFKSAWAGRQKMIFVGSNGGMLHCFKPEDGDELWAYIPFNLLYHLKKIGKKEKKTGYYIFNHKGETYVDATPVAADVFIDADGDGNEEWATVLVCGQGKAKGKGLKDQKKYHYFALDITNPEDPQPLWEIAPDKMGYTQSRPEIGRVIWEDEEKWVAFLSSGEDKGEPRLFCVDMETGEILWSFKGEGKGMPAGPSVYDIDNDGTLDRVYIGDLKGRLWKVDLTEESWEAVVIYKDKEEYPIRTKAAVWMDAVTEETTPHLYFGTGGSDEAKDDKEYAFIALIDKEEPELEWYIGKATAGKGSINMGSLEKGEKFWSDPVIADSVIYFSSFQGNIEDVDPVEGDDDTPGKLYARFISSLAGMLGGTALDSGEAEYMTLASKTRAALTVGGVRETAGGTEERDVWINEYNSTLQVLSRGGGTLKDHPDEPGGTSGLKIRSWREVRELIRHQNDSRPQ